jgi:hypothetical protein
MPTDPTDALTMAALDRLKRATGDRDPSGYTAVNSDDVMAVALSLKEKGTGVTAALFKGAVGAGVGVETHQRTDHLLHLIERAG